MRIPNPPTKRELAGLLVGLTVLATVATADLLLGSRSIPLTAVLLAPLVASAVCGPVLVGGLALVAVGAGAALGVHDALPRGELVSRVLLVAAAGLFSVVVAGVRSRREQALGRADRVASLANTLQRGLLPRTVGTTTVNVSSVYRPGQRDLLLGGDFIDVLALPDGTVGFCVGDVAGHGAVAAALGSALRAGWRTQALSSSDLTGWLVAMDRLLTHEVDGDEQFATVLVGSISADGQSAVLANAGHPVPIRLTDTADLVALKAGPPLGVPTIFGDGWDGQHVTLGVRWGLLLYTDGLIEGRRAPGSSARYGDHNLAAWLSDNPSPHLTSRADLDRLVNDVEAANGQPLEDDVAIVLLSSTSR